MEVLGRASTWGFNEEHGNGMVGWTFNLQEPLTVTAVGWYDDGEDGLSRPFQVGLWQDLSGYFAPGSSPPQLLGSAEAGITIPGGTSASLLDSWRIVPLTTPLTLAPGNYELAGLDTAVTTDLIKYVLADPPNPIPPTAPGMAIVQFFYAPIAPSPTFQMTDSDQFYLADGLELGPMLFTSIPEPSALVLVGLAGAMVLLIRNCPRHRRNHLLAGAWVGSRPAAGSGSSAGR